MNWKEKKIICIFSFIAILWFICVITYYYNKQLYKDKIFWIKNSADNGNETALKLFVSNRELLFNKL